MIRRDANIFIDEATGISAKIRDQYSIQVDSPFGRLILPIERGHREPDGTLVDVVVFSNSKTWEDKRAKISDNHRQVIVSIIRAIIESPRLKVTFDER